MQTNLTESGPFERLLTVQIDEAELEQAKEKAARRLSKEMRVKGFRPGKAPRRIVEQMVGADRLRSEALEEALPDIVGNALADAELNPAVVPSVSGTRDTDTGIEVDITVTMWPELAEAPSYRDRRIVLDSLEVSEDEIDAQVDRVREQFAELEETEVPVQEGDYALIDLSATFEGEVLEELTAADLLYEAGSNSLLPGLDEELLGASAGDTLVFESTLPESLGEELAGREVEVTVELKEARAKALPDVTDEWVDEVTEWESVAEMRDSLGQALADFKRRQAGTEFRRRLLDELLEETEIEIPAALIDAETDSIAHSFVHRLESQNIPLQEYLRITGQDEGSLISDLREQAARNLKTRLLLDAVAEVEGVEVDASEVDATITELAASAGGDVEGFRKRLVEGGQIQALVGDMLRQKTIERIVEVASPVDAEGNPIILESPVETDDNLADVVDAVPDDGADPDDRGDGPEGEA